MLSHLLRFTPWLFCFLGKCNAVIPVSVMELLADHCTQKYSLARGSDQTDYGPRWTSWPPLDGSTPLEGVTDESILAFYDAFQYMSKGKYILHCLY